MLLPDGSASTKTSGIKPFCLSICCSVRPLPAADSARSSLELTGKPAWGGGFPRVGLGCTGQTSLCCQGGRAELAAGTAQAPDTAQLLPGSGQGAKELLELLSLAALLLASRGRKQGAGGRSRLSDSVVLHPAGWVQSQDGQMLTRKQNSFSRGE